MFQIITATLLIILNLIGPASSIEGEWAEESKTDPSMECQQPKKALCSKLNDEEYDTYKTAFEAASLEIGNFMDDAYKQITDMHYHQIHSPASAFEILIHDIDTAFINLEAKIPFLRTNERISRAFTDMKERINHASQTLRFHLTINEVSEVFDMLKFNIDEVFLSLKESAWEYQQM